MGENTAGNPFKHDINLTGAKSEGMHVFMRIQCLPHCLNLFFHFKCAANKMLKL
uniref:Uncharacterized protein n=1 Tax=Anguilla anguilla TaxID=7936 RepID=A0A0E9PLZ0_ANGAN